MPTEIGGYRMRGADHRYGLMRTNEAKTRAGDSTHHFAPHISKSPEREPQWVESYLHLSQHDCNS